MANIEVPLTIVSSPGSNYRMMAGIGDVSYGPPSDPPQNSYWFSVYDRITLKPVYNVLQTGNADTVPADLSGKFNTPQYMLVVGTFGLMSAFAPAGALHAFLVDNGAGIELKRLNQLFHQVGCGSLGYVSYAMAGVLGPGAPSNPSVEACQISSSIPVYLTATLIGVVVPSGTTYTPYPLTPPNP